MVYVFNEWRLGEDEDTIWGKIEELGYLTLLYDALFQ